MATDSIAKKNSDQAVALTIAGSDPSGGAGLQADLKTFHQHQVYGMSVLTLMTVQNTSSVTRVETLPVAWVREQCAAVWSDIPPQAAKTGALGNSQIIQCIGEFMSVAKIPWVVDPVMISKHGMRLIEDSALDAVRRHLLPQCFLVTPNLHEAAVLAEMDVYDPTTMCRAAERIAELGPRNVLVKGGHLANEPCDLLWQEGKVTQFSGVRYDTTHTHGTGCVYSAAITARLARGIPLPAAVAGAHQFVNEAIRTNPGLGHGHGPVNLFAPVELEA